MEQSGMPTTIELDTDEHRREWLREAVTMALYVSLSLLAVLVALPPGQQLSETDLALTVLVTSIALLFAHAVAFRLSSRLVNKGLLDDVGRKLLAAQLAGGLATAVIASAPVFLLGSAGIRISEFLLLAFVAVTGYRAARSVPASRTRSLAYVGVLVLVVLAVLFVKSLVGH